MFVFHRRSRHRLVSAALKLPRLDHASISVRERLRRLRSETLLVILLVVVPAIARAQQADSIPQLGLGASSAISLHVGAGQIKHASLGTEVGGAIDIGWAGARWIRLSVGLDYLTMVIDRPDSLAVRERGNGYVFTTFADLNAIPMLTRRVSPYGGVGFGIDAVGTTISNEQVGSIYNTNVFDVHAQAGLLFRVTPRGRLMLEGRATGARVVRRAGVRLGYTWFYNQLP